jgi:hypothetical protein
MAAGSLAPSTIPGNERGREDDLTRPATNGVLPESLGYERNGVAWGRLGGPGRSLAAVAGHTGTGTPAGQRIGLAPAANSRAAMAK